MSEKKSGGTENMKCKYETNILPFLDRIEAWTRNGVSEKDVAKNLNVAYSTFRDYKNRYPALSSLLARTRVYVDEVIVENAYLKRVTGYDAVETRREYSFLVHEDGSTEKVLTKEIEQVRHIPPDPRAGEFWLTNRQPDKWKYKKPEENQKEETEDTGGVIMMPEVKK